MKHNAAHRQTNGSGHSVNHPVSQAKDNAGHMKKTNYASARDATANAGGGGGGGGGAGKARNTNSHHNHHHHVKHYQPGRISPRSPITYVSPVGVSRLASPSTAFFASSKYLDAPSPKTLPAPPTKWITTQEPPKRQLFNSGAAVKAAAKAITPIASCSLASAAEVAGRSLCSDIFSQNLKLILNVQA